MSLSGQKHSGKKSLDEAEKDRRRECEGEEER